MITLVAPSPFTTTYWALDRWQALGYTPYKICKVSNISISLWQVSGRLEYSHQLASLCGSHALTCLWFQNPFWGEETHPHMKCMPHDCYFPIHTITFYTDPCTPNLGTHMCTHTHPCPKGSNFVYLQPQNAVFKGDPRHSLKHKYWSIWASHGNFSPLP